jgi:hypothetical protein
MLKLVKSQDMAAVTEAYLSATQPARIPTALVQQARRENGCCNGNCNQGRMCDCVPDLPEPEVEPMSAADHRLLLAILAASVFAAVGTVALLMAYR